MAMTAVKELDQDSIAEIILSVRKRLEAEGRLPAAAAPQSDAARPVAMRVMPQAPVSAPPPPPANDQVSPAVSAAPGVPPVAPPQPAVVAEPVPAPAPSRPESANDNALMGEAIEKGLSDLLSSWDIFEKSGLIGMGPSGKDHPTYQKIAQLPMGKITTGEWEGRDMSVVANINEYIAGWQTEQGITPDPTETFDHYLRRVINRYLSAGT